MIQSDDGSRNALNMFMKERDTKASDMIHLLTTLEERWKARVFLELLWEYEASNKRLRLVSQTNEGEK